MPREEGIERGIQAGLIGHAARVVGITRVAWPFRVTDDLRQTAKQAVVAGRDDDFAVRGGIAFVRHDAGGARTVPSRCLAASQYLRGDQGHPGRRRLEQGHIYDPAAPACLALQQRGQHTDDRPHARAHVNDGCTHAHRGSAGFAGGAHDAAECLHQRVVARMLPQRPGTSERTHIAIDQGRLECQQRRATQAQRVDLTGPQILQHDVGALGDEAPQGVGLLRVTQVADDGLLVAVERLKQRRGAFLEGRAPGARGIAIGLNYFDHAAEVGAPIPKEPIIFMKATSCIQGPDDPVMLPEGSLKGDWEVELGVVIGQRARYVQEDAALDYVAGYCVVNDVSEREFQMDRGGTWDKGKGCDTFGPIGPWLVTPDEVPDPQALDLWLDLNGQRMQTGNTRTMIFSVKTIVSYVSRFMTLLPGDVIITGTPPGVGLGMTPPVFLREGDVMTLGVQGLGSQRQRVVGFAR
ncbi:fumarylacetoacetate (FAA) hydrolase family protein [Bordetella holmesii ATCC 51541]|nr:fumarylacetoacetate (FAA) hydrolase family protein [Bordetella holmesii ATCC 51541]